jgi:hypothetical protein
MLQFTTLRVAAAGEPILPFFYYLRGLADLVNRRSRYVPDWVRVFYPTVYVEADKLSLRFMFMGQQSYFKLTSTMTRSTTLPTRTLRLHVVLTHQCYPQTTRSAFYFQTKCHKVMKDTWIASL